MSTLAERLEIVAASLEKASWQSAAVTVREALAELESAAEDQQWLAALECAGVDNWDGCEEASALLREWEEDATKNA